MANIEIDLSLFLKKIQQQKWTIAKWCAVGAFIGVVIGFSIPKEYMSQVLLAPETANNANTSGVGGLAAMMGVNIGGANSEGVNNSVYPKIISSTPFLLEFAEIPVVIDGKKMSMLTYMTENQNKAWWSYVFSLPGKVYGKIRGANKSNPTFGDNEIYVLSDTLRSFKNNLSSRIAIKEDKESKTFTLTVLMQDPFVSTIIADSLVTKLQKYVTAYRTNKIRMELISTVKMRDEAKEKYYKLDTLFAKKVDRNLNMISRTGMIAIERIEDERELAFQLYKQLASQAELTKIKLLENSAIATVIEPAIVPNKVESPNKKIIAIGFLFLGLVGALLKILIGMLRNDDANEE